MPAGYSWNTPSERSGNKNGACQSANESTGCSGPVMCPKVVSTGHLLNSLPRHVRKCSIERSKPSTGPVKSAHQGIERAHLQRPFRTPDRWCSHAGATGQHSWQTCHDSLTANTATLASASSEVEPTTFTWPVYEGHNRMSRAITCRTPRSDRVKESGRSGPPETPQSRVNPCGQNPEPALYGNESLGLLRAALADQALMTAWTQMTKRDPDVGAAAAPTLGSALKLKQVECCRDVGPLKVPTSSSSGVLQSQSVVKGEYGAVPVSGRRGAASQAVGTRPQVAILKHLHTSSESCQRSVMPPPIWRHGQHRCAPPVRCSIEPPHGCDTAIQWQNTKSPA